MRNVGLVYLGVIALPLAFWRGWAADKQAAAARQQADETQKQVAASQEQSRTAHEPLLHDRYQKAAEALAGPVSTARLGNL